MNNSAPSFSLTGRYEYLIALQSHWPDFWKSLEKDVLQRIDRELFFPEAWNDAFDRWAEHTRVRDEWLLEAAWQTLCVWTKGSFLDRDPAKPWFCYAPEVHLTNFQPCLTEPRPAITAPFGVSSRAEGALRVLLPLPETPQQFARRMKRQFNKQLAEYCRAYENVFTPYERKPQLAKHADWTVLFQSGKSPKEIESFECGGTRKRLTHAAILTSIKAFSNSIALTLRESTRGRTTRGSAKKRRNISSV